MNYEVAIKTMRGFFKTYWATLTLNPAVAIAYDDMPFDKPNGVPWIRMVIKHVDGEEASIGSPGANRQRRYGIITFQVFTPSGTDASLSARKLVDLVLANYFSKDNAGVSYYRSHAKEVGNDGFGWYQFNALVYFRYDNIA